MLSTTLWDFGFLVCLVFLIPNKIRIMLLWYACAASVVLIDMNDQLLHVKIDCLGTSTSLSSFYATFVYGLHSRTTRKSLWLSLQGLGIAGSDPWMVLGDFNSYLSADDKQGGNLIKNHETEFVDCV